MSSPAAMQVTALGERRALRAVPGDAVDLAGVGDAVVLRSLDGQGDDHDGVVGLRRVVEVLEVRVDAAESVEELGRELGRRGRAGEPGDVAVGRVARREAALHDFAAAAAVPAGQCPPARCPPVPCPPVRARRFGARHVVSRGRSWSPGRIATSAAPRTIAATPRRDLDRCIGCNSPQFMTGRITRSSWVRTP